MSPGSSRVPTIVYVLPLDMYKANIRSNYQKKRMQNDFDIKVCIIHSAHKKMMVNLQSMCITE